jgi:hypothetical protein
MKITSPAAKGLQVVTKVFTRTLQALDGEVAYTGYGFKPKCLFLIAYCDALDASSWAFWDKDNAICLYQVTDDPIIYNEDMDAVYIVNSSWNGQMAELVSIDADGFTVHWRKEGALTGTITITVLALG